MCRGLIRRLEKLEEKYARDHPVHIQLYWIQMVEGPDGKMVKKWVPAW
jgi:hypothetical protein